MSVIEQQRHPAAELAPHGKNSSSAESDRQSAAFSFTQARSLIGDLSRPNPVIYWTDFLFSVTGGHIAFALTLLLPQSYAGATWLIPTVVMTYAAAVILYMRAAMFIHELVHLPKDGFRGFRIAWNALFGCWFMVPSFLYYPHVDHHRRKHYGTKHDGEYLALSHTGRWMIIGFVVQALIIPLFAIARFFLISPVCWLIPAARRYIHRHASTMLVDPSYERTDAKPKVLRMVVVQEFCCFLTATILICGPKLMTGNWFHPLWVVVYAVAVGVIVLNEVRTLGSHRWNHTGDEMSFQEQLLDSVNYPHFPMISELWGPIGTRYHALHHLFPRLPYHNLGKAHRRLVDGLPPDSPYHETIAPSLTSEIIALWNRAAS